MAKRAYTVVITRTRLVEVIDDSWQEAKDTVEEMYLSGDAVAELEDATFGIAYTRELDGEGNPIIGEEDEL